MGAVELGGDMHREIQVPHRLERYFRIRHRNGEIAAQTDQSLRAAIPDRLDGFDRVVALVAWRLEPKRAPGVEKLVIREFGDADRPVSLTFEWPAAEKCRPPASDVRGASTDLAICWHIAVPWAVLGDPPCR